jgi:PST family polysaccharide transporter
LGIFLRVASWPMAFTMIAKGKMKLVFWTELATNILLIGLTWIGIVNFGLPGTGMAFFGMYLFYWILIFSIVKYVTRFTWSASNVRLGLLSTSSIIVVFSAQYVLPDAWYMLLGSTVTLGFAYYSIKHLLQIVDLDGVAPIFSKFIKRFDIVVR